MITVFEGCVIFDGSNEHLFENGYVIIEGELIVEIGTGAPTSCSSARRVSCGGRLLMPGLIDAHVHAYAPSFDFHANDYLPPALLVIHASTALKGMLSRGFTTVRDAGGADRGLWLAIERGLIKGPRLFYPGKALSQTGGHGDMRPADWNEPCGCASYSGSISRVADGVDAVRTAVRDELRQGAHQIKLFVSGGVTSPTDPIWMNQFTDLEILAAVEEAATRRTYVMAHCHTDEAVRRCIKLGVRSIEHGTEIFDETAAILAARDIYVVPTLSVADIARRHGQGLGLPESSLQKIKGVYEQMSASVERCAKAGVKLGLGSDILGEKWQVLQGGELALRGEIQEPIEVLRSATSINAALLNETGRLGCVAVGALADLLIVEGDPFKDLSVFSDPDKQIPVIMKGGEFVKYAL